MISKQGSQAGAFQRHELCGKARSKTRQVIWQSLAITSLPGTLTFWLDQAGKGNEIQLTDAINTLTRRGYLLMNTRVIAMMSATSLAGSNQHQYGLNHPEVKTVREYIKELETDAAETRPSN